MLNPRSTAAVCTGTTKITATNSNIVGKIPAVQSWRNEAQTSKGQILCTCAVSNINNSIRVCLVHKKCITSLLSLPAKCLKTIPTKPFQLNLILVALFLSLLLLLLLMMMMMLRRYRSPRSSTKCCFLQSLWGWWTRLMQLYSREIGLGRQHYPRWRRWEGGICQICNITGSASLPQAVNEFLPELAFRQSLNPFA